MAYCLQFLDRMQSINERGGTDEGGYGGKNGREKGAGRKRIGLIDDLLGKERYGVLKRRSEDRQEWRIWLPGTCRMAEH